MRPTQFTIDDLGTKLFTGYSKGERWNGFACPYFTFEQAQEIVKAYHARDEQARYDAKSDAFVFATMGEQDEREASLFQGLLIEGIKLYPIGAFHWMWTEV